MNRARRTKILVEGQEEFLRSLASAVEAGHEVVDLEAPNEGLVMIKVRETAKASLFYLGEILVTEAKVMIDGNIGIGIIAGHKPEAARQLAIIDAACGGVFRNSAAWDWLLESEEEKTTRRKEGEAARIMRTKVEFESMDVGIAQ